MDSCNHSLESVSVSCYSLSTCYPRFSTCQRPAAAAADSLAALLMPNGAFAAAAAAASLAASSVPESAAAATTPEDTLPHCSLLLPPPAPCPPLLHLIANLIQCCCCCYDPKGQGASLQPAAAPCQSSPLLPPHLVADLEAEYGALGQPRLRGIHLALGQGEIVVEEIQAQDELHACRQRQGSGFIKLKCPN